MLIPRCCRAALRAACLAVAAVLSAPAPSSAAGAAGDSLDTEFDYAAKLIDLGFPECAQYLADRLLRDHPEIKDRVNVVRAQALISQRRLAQAEDIVKTMPRDNPKAQAIRLALADGYFQVGQQDQCSAIYGEFFKQYGTNVPSDPDVLRFYQTAAHKFAQMLAYRNSLSAAARIYDLLLAALQDPELSRQVRVEQAETLLRAARTERGADVPACLAKAGTNCNDVIWGGSDLWFGRAVACLAQIQIVRREKDEAMRLLQSNLAMLRKLDDLLQKSGVPPSESPLAGARSLLGDLYRGNADLLLAGPEPREAEALGYFERAAAEYEAVWALIERIGKRDATLVEKDPKLRASLTGTPAERQKPFDDLTAAAKELDAAATAPGDKGWSPAAAPRATALRERLRILAGKVVEFPRATGATPSPDFALGEGSKGRALQQRGLEYLAAESARRKSAIELYTKALQQFYNVFAGYPGSDWAAEAGKKVESLKEQLQTLTGQTVTIEVAQGGRKKVGLVMLGEGNDLFARKEYAKAAEAFRKGLNDYPEGDESVVALANLAESYVQLNDPLRVKMLAGYIGERFGDRPQAAQGLLRLGRLYFEKNDRLMYEYVYERYLRHFPTHSAASSMLYMLGEQRWKAQDYAGALPYYRRVVERYANGPQALKSWNRIGWSHYLSGDYGKAAEVFRTLVGKAYPGVEKAQGQLCLADALRQTGDYAGALQCYAELEKWLTEKDSPYAQPAEGVSYQDILEQAVFFQAYCMARLEKPAEQVPVYRKAAIERYRAFVARFPDSKLAPTALSSLGAVLLGEGRSQEAAAAYQDLSAKYPQSEAGQNARFSMVRSLLDIGQVAKAREVARDMAANAKSYPPDHFVRLGQLLLEEGEFEVAAQAFDEAVRGLQAGGQTPAVQGKTKQDMEQRALLGLGKASYELKKYDAAAQAAGELVTRFPTSGLFYEARFLLGRAYRETGRTADAVAAMKEVFQRASDRALLNRANLELARIQVSQGDKAEALASCQRIVLLADPDDPAVRPIYRDALLLSVRLLAEMQRWAEVTEGSDRFLLLFPGDEGGVEIRKWKTQAAIGGAAEAPRGT